MLFTRHLLLLLGATSASAATTVTTLTLPIPGITTMVTTFNIPIFPSSTPVISFPGITTIKNPFTSKKRQHTVSTQTAVGVTTATIRVSGFTKDTGTLTLPVNPEPPTMTPVIARTGFATCTTKKRQHGEHTTATTSRVPERTHVRRAAAMRC